MKALSLAIGLLLAVPIISYGLPLDELNIPDDAIVCYVQAGANEGGSGSELFPYDSLADVEADAACTVILVMKSKVNDLALDGGILLKPGQRLFGLGQDVTKPGNGPKKRALITNTIEENLVDGLFDDLTGNRGVGVILSQDNEVAGVHIDGTFNAAIGGINVTSTSPGVPGAIIHHVLISNAVTSGDPLIDAFGLFQDSAAIEISIAELPLTLGGPPGDGNIQITDSIIRDGISGISSVANFPFVATLALDNVTVERMNPAYALDAEVFVLRAIAAAATQLITINNSRFFDIDNRIPAILPQVVFDSGHMEVTINNSIFSNPSNLSSFRTLPDGSPLPRGDGFTAILQGGTADIELTDFTIENVGQDAIEIESDFLAFPPLFGPPPFEITRSSVATMTIERVIIKNSGRADLVPVMFILVPVPATGPASTADKQIWSVSNSTFEGSGALNEFWGGGTSVLAWYAFRPIFEFPNSRPLGNADNIVFDLGGGELGSNGQNRFVDTTEDTFQFVNLENVTIDAQENWWGTMGGLDPALVRNFNSPGSGVDAGSPLSKDPRPSEGKGKGNR